MNKKTLEQIRMAMQYRGITQKDLAQKMGISEVSLSRIFNGKTQASEAHLLKISEILDTTITIQP